MTDNLPALAAPVSPPALATVLRVQPADMMNYAITVSNTLTKVLREKGLTKRFGQGEHVLVEGWELAGSLLGLTIAEKSVGEDAQGNFTAEVQLQNPETGHVLATATGYCGTDEPTWAKKPRYARRSMALTRAVGRVYRQNFSWLIKLAGFEPTPAEEMPEHAPDVVKAEQIYTNDNDAQKKLATILGKLNVPGDLWEGIGEDMKGKVWNRTNVDQAVHAALERASRI